jgi:hypothetical protein
MRFYCDLLHIVYALFTLSFGRSERRHSPQIVMEIEGGEMSKLKYLREQAAKAERLAQTIMDTLTAQRLREIAAEFRAEADQLSGDDNGANQPEACADQCNPTVEHFSVLRHRNTSRFPLT